MFLGVAISNWVPHMGDQNMILSSWNKPVSANGLLIRGFVCMLSDPPICKLIINFFPCFSTKEHMSSQVLLNTSTVILQDIKEEKICWYVSKAVLKDIYLHDYFSLNLSLFF